MIEFFLRSLVFLMEPLGLVWLCLWALAALLWRQRRRRLAAVPAAAAVMMSLVGSTPLVGWLVASMERPFIVENLDSVPECDAVIVLGGGVQPSKYDAFYLDLKPAADRIVMGLELVRRGKARNMVLGGAVHRVRGREHIEADMTRDWLQTWGLTNAALFSLGPCANTHDEALKTAGLAKERGWKRLLLVTSAYHMKRARAVFLTAGVPVVCVPCDFQTDISVETEDSLQLVPRAGGFMKISLFIHEKIGWRTYRSRGWIDADVPGAASGESR